MNNAPVVSVICLTYNHEKYIRRCLESIINQDTEYKFEVLVHDDASTDNTAGIINEYQKNYPDIIKPVFQSENQYSKGVSVTKNDLLPRVHSKYIAFCEGDDYWCDNLKIQTQVTALEANPICVASFHRVRYVDILENPTGRTVPPRDLKEGVMDQDYYMKYTFYPEPIRCFPWQISGLLVRKDIWEDYLINPPPFRKAFDVGDQPLFFHLGINGSVYYIPRIMSCYRRGGNETSWLGTTLKDKEKLIRHLKCEMNALSEVDKFTNYKYHEFAQYGINNHQFQIYRANHDFKRMKSEEMRYLYKQMSIKHRLIYRFYPIVEVLKRITKK